ncbi:Lrp/AsnC ligand binding domain-containing protein [Streptomyces sp. NPDC059740]|uniref:Lrp/AsnC ligand binding domain-containing protein n=1 Tax=Streptomyces sp. NPDC059740 TaxID=3346926 RepID=UPI003656FD63
MDATTAARRWRRLSGSGLAWLTAYPVHQVATVCYVDVACRPDRVEVLTEQLRRWSCVFDLGRSSGEHQLLLGVAAASLPALDAFLTRGLGRLDGVRSLRSGVALRVYREGSDWTAGSLAADQRSLLAADGRTGEGGGPVALREADRQLLLALGADARSSCAELARRCGLGETTVRRRLRRMERHHEILFRCDFAPLHAGWPVAATYRLRVPSHRVEEVARTLAAMPESRLCAAVTGTANLRLILWLRSPDGCRSLEDRIAARCPEAEVVERDITLYTAKRMGRLLDRRGRAVGHVPVTAWPRCL